MKNSCVQWVEKELAIVLPYLFYSDLQYNFRQGWRHAFNGYCDHCSWKKLSNWLQCRSSLRCCNQSVNVYQNCLEQSEKHVCNGAYDDHYNYMETRHYVSRQNLPFSYSNQQIYVKITIKITFKVLFHDSTYSQGVSFWQHFSGLFQLNISLICKELPWLYTFKYFEWSQL